MGSNVFLSLLADEDRFTFRSCRSTRLFGNELGDCVVVVVVVVKVSLSSEYCEMSWNENCKNGSADLRMGRVNHKCMMRK